MRTELFDFDLPEDRIALYPLPERDAARLLVVQPNGDPELMDRGVADLPELLRAGDVLVFNDTRVIPAALTGTRIRGGAEARVEFNLHKRVDESRWRAFARPAKRLEVGDLVRFGDEGRVCLLGTLDATVTAKGEGGEVELAFSMHGAYLDQAIDSLGNAPLPPYIAGQRPATEEDRAAYQTIYARREGAVAAPTAGLHFTERLLETAAGETGEIRPFAGETALFITPGYRFRAVDLMVTNFHLPRSTLFILVAAFSGLDRMKRAYAHAIATGYRFYSYGDACLLYPAVDPQ